MFQKISISNKEF